MSAINKGTQIINEKKKVGIAANQYIEGRNGRYSGIKNHKMENNRRSNASMHIKKPISAAFSLGGMS